MKKKKKILQLVSLELLFFFQFCSGQCPSEVSCGWKSQCVNGSCQCSQGYTLHSNLQDCQNVNCSQQDCLECGDPGCHRCTNFLDEETLNCLEKCNGQAQKLQLPHLQGSICKRYENNTDNINIIIGIVSGVSAGILLCVIVGIIFYCHLKRTRNRKKINLHQKHYKAENMQAGTHTTIPLYDNKGFEPDADMLPKRVVNKEVYLAELDKLRPQAPSLLTLLNHIRQKLRAMDPQDTRVSTYKGVIHQLCRVLVLVHKKDPGVSIPSDALGLLEWATQMLEDHQMGNQEQNSSGNSAEVGESKISYIDVPDKKQNHQYAVPNVTRAESDTNIASQTSYYSSAPVPVEYHSHTLPSYAKIRNSVSTLLPDKSKGQRDTVRKSAPYIVSSSKSNDSSLGYFRNGHYYDPGPNPDVYAPASSYSDRSTKLLSTFQSDLRRTPSISSSVSSAGRVAREEADDESVNNDPLPFDPKDATEPVEV
uniref:Uncharacterized protein LOC111118831 isoform X1 n=1 Tax=Crassostrea virginica TaxID=6565 RepID=A0A8B8CG82_CRAVI|nr:uncharacterized protein LOC111118831 isoform X1 [Crassostrea virginica]XP_022314185.1 uncharacterized protein LOC111118831 isoform X1 [Crassostrea virginica]